MLNWVFDTTPIQELWQYDTVVTSGNETLFFCSADDQTHFQYVHHTSRRDTGFLGE